MRVELVPVIEVCYNRHKVKYSSIFPYWKYPDIWDKYHAACNTSAGFPDRMLPYCPGSAFFRLRDISQANLTRLVKNHLESLLSLELSRGHFTPFNGGFVLKINSKTVLYPQCCGNLSDINYWEALLTNTEDACWKAHPVPIARAVAGEIMLKCRGKSEKFVPPVPDVIRLDKDALSTAVHRAKRQLQEFCGRLQDINEKEKIHISGIGGLLVWGDQYEAPETLNVMPAQVISNKNNGQERWFLG